ncbi:MAG: hypothetical protein JXQ29_09750 [Planctomycetes bacterium]|nr:hypothetical protein [Planctomycetota bacterium]
MELSFSEEVELGKDGRFEIAVPEAGEYAVGLAGPGTRSGRHTSIHDRVLVQPGGIRWDLRMAVGGLVVEGLKALPTLAEIVAAPGDPKEGYWAAATLAGGREWSSELCVGRRGRWEIEHAPSGTIRLGERNGQNYHLSPHEREPAITVTVKPGEVTRVRWPG